MGCTMMRKCHLNTCPVGVATQVNFFFDIFTLFLEFFHFHYDVGINTVNVFMCKI